MRILLLLALSASLARAQETSFGEVARYLNPDGDFYLYLNSEQFGKKLMDFTASLEEMLGDAPQAGPAAAMFESMREMWRESGLLQIKGVGMSSVLWKEGLYANRSVAYHGEEPITGKLWQLGAGEPHEFDGLKLMPANTVIGFTGTFRLDEFFTFMMDLAPKLDPKAEKGMDGMRKQWKEQGDDLDATMASFTGEVTFILTMNLEKMRQVSPEISIPDIGLLVAFGVSDDQLYTVIAREINRAPKAEPLTLPGIVGVTARDPARGPFPLQPTIAKSATRLFLATTPELLAEALATDGRLADTKEYAHLRGGLPDKGNQLVFVSKTLTSQVKRIARGALAKQVGPGDATVWAEHREQLPKLRMHGVPLDGPQLLDAALAKPGGGRKVLRYLDALGDYQGCIISVHQADAVVAYSNESVSLPGRGMVAMGAMAAGMIMPAIAIRSRQPQVVHQQNSAEILRQQGLAKLRRLGGVIRAISGEDRDHRELPPSFAVIPNTGKLQATSEIWDCPGTPAKTLHVAESDYVYLGATLIDWAEGSDRRVIVHSPVGAYEGKWVNFLFLDGHVESQAGNDPKAIVQARDWIYGVREGEDDAVKPPDSYGFRLEFGKLVLLDAADEREVGQAHPSEAFNMPLLQLKTIAPWDGLCWVGTNSGLFRYDAAARSWSRFAVERTQLDVSIDSLVVEGDLLQVGYAKLSATFNLKTRTWMTGVTPVADAVEAVAPPVAKSATSLNLMAMVLIAVLVLGIVIFAVRRKFN